MSELSFTGFTCIHIANIAEAFAPVLLQVNDAAERNSRVSREHTLGQRALFWEGDNKIVVTQLPVESALIQHCKTVCKFSRIVNLTPDSCDINLSSLLHEDTSLWSSLVRVIKNSPGITISPYAVTDHFLRLVDRLRREKLYFTVKELPVAGAEWTIEYLDSKTGFRFELLKRQDLDSDAKIPNGFACNSAKEAVDIASWFYNKKRSSVIKANRGESGWGILMLHHEDFASQRHLQAEINSRLSKETIWSNELLIVEEYIRPSKKTDTASPSVEVFVEETGPRVNYICQQILGTEGEFLGIATGKDAVNPVLEPTLKRIGLSVGKRYWELGYRGFFDLDCVVSADNGVFLVETNMRRTGGTHVFDLAQRLFGQNWQTESWLFSEDSFCYGAEILPVESILQRINHLLFPIAEERKGFVVTLASKFEPVFGYVVVAASRSEGEELRSEMTRLW